MTRYFLWILLICMATYSNGSKPRKIKEPNLTPQDLTTENYRIDNGNSYNICGLGTSNELATDMNDAFQRAVGWVLSQRSKDWGWPFYTTAIVILSLQLTTDDDSWYRRGANDLTKQLSVKQLEIEILGDLSQTLISDTNNASSEIRTLPNISPGSLAYYIMALNSTCHDVTNFYGNNLVKILTKHMDHFPQDNFNNYFQYGLALLALCKSGAPIKTQYIQQIMDGQSQDGSFRFGTDVVSMALMAMSCIQDKVPATHSKMFLQRMKRSTNFLLSNQESDGIFGNHVSTSLAAQALMAAQKISSNWNCQAALRTVLDAQEVDGSFGSLGDTLQILPLLVRKTFANVKDINPSCDVTDKGDKMDNGPEIQVVLVIENGVDTSAEALNLSVAVPENSTLYEAMLNAAEQHPDNFSFEASLTQYGHSVDEINGVANDNDNYYYWIILIGPDRISATTGVDEVMTDDGGTYILHYKSFAY